VATNRTGPVDVSVLDLLGRPVRALAHFSLPAGASQELSWDGRRGDATPAPAGIYWVRMRWPGGSDVRKVVKLE